jgi:hypothetical protein
MAEGFLRGGLAAKKTAEEMAKLTTVIALAATGFQIAGVVGYQLYAHWDKLMDLFGRGATLTEAENMDKLEKATHRTAEETKLLNKYKKEQQEIESLLAKGTKTEQHQGKEVEKVITEAGAADVHRGLTNVLQRDKSTELSIAEEDKALKGSRVSIVNGKVVPNTRVNPETGEERKLASPREVKEAEDRLHAARREKAKEKAGQLLTQATHSPEKLEELMGHVNANREKFPEAFGAQLSYATPEKVKEAERAAHDKKVRAQEEQEERKANSDRDEIVRQREHDDAEKERRRLGEEADAKRFAHENDQKNRERLEQARKALPGVDEKTETAALRSKIKGNFESGGSLGIARQISSALQAKGWDAAEAMSAGAGIVGAAGEKVEEKAAKIETHPKVDMAGMIKENMAWGMTKKAATRTAMKKVAMMGAEGEGQAEAGSILANQRWDQARISRSETFGTSQLTSKVQSAITNGGDDKNMGKNMNKVANVVDEMYKLLAQKNAGNTFTIKVD